MASEPEPEKLLAPTVVGDIAHGQIDTANLTTGQVRQLADQGLTFAAAGSLASANAAMQTSAERQLASLARTEALRSMVTAATASQVAEILHAADVRALVYKGAGLAALTTGSWLGRGSSDVDVLVSPTDTSRAHQALTEAGLSRRDGETGPPSRALKFRQCERSYAGLETTVDLHWRVEATPGYFSAPLDALWRRRWDYADSGIRFSTPGKADALLITAVHGARERYWKWRWVLDAVRQVEAQDPTDWQLAQRLGRQSGSSHALAICAAVACLAGAENVPGVQLDRRDLDRARRWLGQGFNEATSKGAGAALSRKLDGLAVGDSAVQALDGFVRAVARQVAPDGEKERHRLRLGGA